MQALKILVVLFVVAVIIVVGGGTAFIVFSDPNDFKNLVIEKVHDSTGRTLSLDGDLEWAFWPKLRLKAGPLALSNAPGFGDDPFLAADEIQVAVATLPLLRKQVEMETIKLHGVMINLARNADGVSNWDDLAGPGAQEEEDYDGDGIAALAIGGVDIKDTRITWQDDTTGQKVTISNVNVATGELVFGDPIDFSLSLTAVANQPALDVDANLTATVSYDLDDEHYVITPLAFESNLRGAHLPGGQASIQAGANIDINVDEEIVTITGLSVSGLGIQVDGEFTATEIEHERPSANGQLTVTGKDLAQIFNAFELPVGKQLAGIADRSFDFAAAFDANMDSGEVKVSKLEGNMLGAHLTGGFDATQANTDKPIATGSLSVAGPNLPTLLAVLGQIQGMDGGTLKNLNAALASVGDKSFSINADIDANLPEGKASLPKLEAKLLGNTISGTVQAENADTDKPAVKGTLKAQGPDFPALLAVAATFQQDGAALAAAAKSLAKQRNKRFEVTAGFVADMKTGRVDVPKIEAKLLGNTITGQLTAENADSDKPAVKGSFEAKGADLAGLLAVAAGFQAGGAWLRDMAKELRKEKNKSFNVSADFDADMKSGRIELSKLAADLLGLEIRGSVKGEDLDFEEGDGSLDGKLTVASKDLGPLLRGIGQTELATSIKSLNLDAGVKGSLSDLTISPLNLTATVTGEEVKKPVELKVTADSARADLDKETMEIDGLSVTGLGLNVKANVDAQQIMSEPAFSGRLDVAPFNVRSLLASLGQPAPKTVDPKALTSFSLGTNFNGTMASVALNDLVIKLDKSTLKGDIDVASFEGPDLSFGVGIDAINADDYMEPTAPGKAKPATPEAAAAGAATELPMETLRALKIKGDLLIGNLVLSGAKMRNIKFSIRADGGQIKLDPLGAELYQGTYGGIISLDATRKEPSLGINTQLKGVHIEPLIKDTVGNDMLSGIVNFDAALTSTGGDAQRIKNTLNGEAKFSTTNGVFRGVDAIAVLRAVEQIVECNCPIPVPKGGETRFNILRGTLQAKNGVVSNQDLVLAGDGFRITGKGMLANLRNDSVKYNLTLAVAEARKGQGQDYNLGGYEVPIKCRGKIEAPSCLPDFGGILKEVLKKAVTDKIGDKLKDAVGGEAGKVLKKLFKF